MSIYDHCNCDFCLRKPAMLPDINASSTLKHKIEYVCQFNIDVYLYKQQQQHF